MIAVIIAAACSTAGGSNREFRTSSGPVRAVTVASGLSHPWALAFLPDGRMLVTERGGAMRIVAADGTVGAALTGLPSIHADGQGGLLDVVLDPDFATTRVIWFSYSEPGEGGSGTAVARARLGDAGLDSVRVVFQQLPKVGSGAHFGSRLAFSPDGHLFVTLGDRRRGDPAQDLTGHIGKVVRLSVTGLCRLTIRSQAGVTHVPRSGRTVTAMSRGRRFIRSPDSSGPSSTARWAATRSTRLRRAATTAGRSFPTDATIPARRSASHFEARDGAAGAPLGCHRSRPSGMAFYTGDRYGDWQGSLFVGSLKFGMISRLELDGARVKREERILEGFNQRVRDIRQGPDGYLYFLTDEGNGRLLRLEPAGGTGQ